MEAAKIEEVVERQRAFFQTHATLDIPYRKLALERSGRTRREPPTG